VPSKSIFLDLFAVVASVVVSLTFDISYVSTMPMTGAFTSIPSLLSPPPSLASGSLLPPFVLEHQQRQRQQRQQHHVHTVSLKTCRIDTTDVFLPSVQFKSKRRTRRRRQQHIRTMVTVRTHTLTSTQFLLVDKMNESHDELFVPSYLSGEEEPTVKPKPKHRFQSN